MVKHLFTYALLIALTSCASKPGDTGIFRDRKYDYRFDEQGTRIEVPDGMDTVAIVDYFPIPELSPYADPALLDEHPLPLGLMTSSEGMIKIQKVGEMQWILAQMSPSQVWPRLKEFIIAQGFSLVAEYGMQGVMQVMGPSGSLTIKVEQGFQRTASEISVDYQAITGSDDQTDLILQSIAEYLDATSDKAAFSFAAQGISTERRLILVHDNRGVKVLLLKATQLRAMASLKSALERAGFEIESSSADESSFLVSFLPPLPEEKEPNFFLKIFGAKAKPYDDEVEYAGNRYTFQLKTEGDYQQVLVTREITEGELLTEEQRKHEQNKQLERIKGLIY